jgi:hypothetical protein
VVEGHLGALEANTQPARNACKREMGRCLPLAKRAWEPQARGPGHVHPVFHVYSAGDVEVARCYVRHVARLGRRGEAATACMSLRVGASPSGGRFGHVSRDGCGHFADTALDAFPSETTKRPRVAGVPLMERAGLEPATPSVQSWTSLRTVDDVCERAARNLA